MMKPIHRAGAVCVTALVAAMLSMTPASAAVSYTNCTALQKTFPHGVGKKHAHDRTSGTPVTNFTHSTKKYNKAMRANDDLDRDGDGIACEKR
jgi:hypothetical protein